MLRYTKAAPTSARAVFIRKAGKYKQSQAAKDTLKKLNDYLNANMTEPMYFLHQLFTNQQNAITYKELREAIMRGYMDEKTLRAWQSDYAKFVVNRLAPIWQEAAKTGAAVTDGRMFDPMGLGMSRWIADHGARWVTAITEETRAAVQAMIDASVSGQFTVDELSRAIRSLIGLNRPQASANLKYYQSVKANLLENNPSMREATAEKRAREAALKYEARQLRQRAQMIAETELAAAYCTGYREFIRQSQAAGLMGKGVFVWDTAEDEAVCVICGALNGMKSNADGQYSVGPQRQKFKYGNSPPAHPRCRCAEHFEETEPPVAQTDNADQFRAMPRAKQAAALGGEDGGRQRAALVNSRVIANDKDVEDLYHAKVVVSGDRQTGTINVELEVTLKSLTELAEHGIVTVSDEAIIHSSIGEYNSAGRIIGGCHSQAGMEELVRRGIEFSIVRTFTNGVRLGHIPKHKERFKRTGMTQAWFPPDWDDDKIMEAGTAVANSGAPLQMGYYKVGEYEGVMVRVLFATDGSGKIISVCPDYNQEVLEGVDYFE